MKINELTTRSDIEQSSKVEKAYFQFEKLLSIIRQRNIPLPVIERINEIIADLNQTPTKDLKNKLRKINQHSGTRTKNSANKPLSQ